MLSLVHDSHPYQAFKNRDSFRFCSAQFGQVNNVIIPRPTAPGTPAPSGLGRVIVEFADDNGCTAAYRVLNGRRFGGRTVVATYLPEQSYQAGQFDI